MKIKFYTTRQIPDKTLTNYNVDSLYIYIILKKTHLHWVKPNILKLCDQCTLQDNMKINGNSLLDFNSKQFSVRISLCLSYCLAPPCSPNDGEKVEKDVDDVCVHVESRKDIFFWTQGQFLVAKQHLCVHRQETGEEQSSQSSIHNVQNPVTDEDAEDAEDDQDNQTDEKHTVTGSEVVFGLQGEDDHGEAHDCCDTHCHDHCVSVMEAGDHSHHVGHAESQDR